jgi:hypothetical protein
LKILPQRITPYGLFLDAVLLLDFISASNHSDSEKTFTAFHNQQKQVLRQCMKLELQYQPSIYFPPFLVEPIPQDWMTMNFCQLFQVYQNGIQGAQDYDTK